ncbi:ankyrin repeat domain-containing protein [Hydrocarboniclastica marina]|nr:ankyrin repeat domain-containing protein [Hydrocarboniclastica marina]|tara:strand:- start:1792 stop:2502 length:711 start_codon:yes stop_codon:yes gene_type:complete
MRLGQKFREESKPPVASWLLLAMLLLTACSNPPAKDVNLGIVTAESATPLIAAAGKGDIARVKALVESKAPVNARGPDATPLTQAAANGNDEVVWYLLRSGAEPDLAPPDGVTALMVASREGNGRIVEMLLRAGAEINSVNATGDTALAWAARNGNLSTVKLLLSRGGNVNVARSGESLLMQVVGQNDLLMSQVLIDAGADVHYRSPDDGETALDVARRVGNEDLVMLLVQSGAGS